MAKRERKKVQEADLDLTPMIDVVFQLIIFFILTMTITQLAIKKVELPIAETSVEEDTEEDPYLVHIYHNRLESEDGRPSANLDPDGWHLALPNISEEFKEVPQLAPKLAEQAEYYADNVEANNENGNSEMTLLLRGDMRAPSHYFSVLLQACMTARIYKIKVSIKPPPSN